MSIFHKSKNADPRVTYERFELPVDPPFPEAEAITKPAPISAAQPTSEWRPAGPEPTTLLIPADSVVEGTISSPGVVRIEGALRGEVRAPTVVLTASGRIEGRVTGTLVTIKGILEGSAVARDIELARTATVDAELTYDEISIERGARVRGLHRQRDHETTAAFQAATAKETSPVLPAGLTTEAELALHGLAQTAGAAAKAAAELAEDGMKSLADLEAHLRAAGNRSELVALQSTNAQTA